MSEPIYSPTPRCTIAWPAAYPRRATPITTAATIQTSTTIACSHDARLIAILEARLPHGEPTHIGFKRKEAELGVAFAELPVIDQRALHARLANPRTGDAFAEKFARLTAERRARLLAFLADARRRAAIAAGR